MIKKEVEEQAKFVEGAIMPDGSNTQSKGGKIVRDHSEHESEHGMREHTGLVGLRVFGERPRLKTPAEIVELAKATEFFEEGSIEESHEGGSVEYVPSPLVEDAIVAAFTEGLLGYKFIINGAPPRHLQELEPDTTYYTYIDFVEGPDFQEGRWIGRVVDEDARNFCLIVGVEIKEEIHYHLDEESMKAHRRPQISSHGIVPLGDADEPVLGTTAGPRMWKEHSGGWKAYKSHGCVTTTTCLPEVVA
jgi:hypothetical protein